MSSWQLAKYAEPIVINDGGQLPNHVAIIMDGNRRWARERGLPTLEGHRRGVRALKKTVKALSDIGVNYLTVFAFSTENSSRTFDEVSGLMNLIQITLKHELAQIHKNGICLSIIGNHDTLPEKVKEIVEYAEQLTANNNRFFLTVALNYGSQQDITKAAKTIAEKVKRGELDSEEITTQLLSQSLSTADLPVPDLLIRSGGAVRISNFLLWELSYAEFIFEKTYWPDFDEKVVKSLLAEFQSRQRRYGR